MSTEDPTPKTHTDDTEPMALKDILGREKRCQTILDKRPDDDGARMEMAWCLLMQAVHRQGQESVIHKIAPLINTQSVALGDEVEPLTHRESRWLFAESLKHSYVVSKLSSNPKWQQEAERLKELIVISAGEDALVDAQGDSATAITQLARDIARRQANRRHRRHRPSRRSFGNQP